MDNVHYYNTYYNNKHKNAYLAKIPEGAYLKAKRKENKLERDITLLSLGVSLVIILLVSFVC